MTLISLIIVFILEHLFKASAILEKELNYKSWFPRWRLWIANTIVQPWFNGPVGLTIILGLPTLILYLIVESNHGFLFWIVQLVLSILVLIYCLGPIEQNLNLQEYFEAVEREDLEAAYLHIDKYIGFESSTEKPKDINALGRLVTRLIFSHSNDQYFAVILYFVILGPAGALLYRLAAVFEESEVEESELEKYTYATHIDKLNKILNWIPARFTAILFLLAGDFVSAISKLKHIILEAEHDSNLLIQETGLGAIGVDSESKLESAEQVSNENNQALALVSRTAVVLMVIIAIMTLSGWLT